MTAIRTQQPTIAETFDSSLSILPSAFWFAQNGGLVQDSGFARISRAAGTGTRANTHKTAVPGGMFVECQTETVINSLGNSWGIFAGAQNNTAVFGAANPGYLVRYQGSNPVPTFFRCSGTNPGGIEFTQIGAGPSGIAFVPGDSLGFRVVPMPNGSVYMEATQNGSVVGSYTDPASTALPVGSYGGMRQSRTSGNASGDMTGTALYTSGAAAPILVPLTGIDFFLTGDSHPGNSNAWPSESGSGGLTATNGTTASPGQGASQNGNKTLTLGSAPTFYRVTGMKASDSFTVAYVGRLDPYTGEMTLFDGNSENANRPRHYLSLLISPTRLSMNAGGSGTVEAPVPSPARWSVVLATFSGDTLSLWLNGIKYTASGVTGGAQLTQLRIFTNDYDGGNRRWRNGTGLVAHWSRALSDAEARDATVALADRYGIPVQIPTLTATTRSSGALSRRITKLLASSIDTAGSLVRSFAKLFGGTISATGTLTKRITAHSAGSVQLARQFVKSVPKSRAEQIDTSGELTKLPATVRTRSLRPSGALRRVFSKVRVGTVALVSAVRTDVRQKHSGVLLPTGTLLRKPILVKRRNVERVDLIAPGWDAFLLRQQYITELLEQSPWRLMLEGSPVLAGSIEELRIGVNYTYGDGAPLPTEVDVDLGDGNWLPGAVTQISASRAVVSIIAGPFAKGTYPVKVRFSTAAQTPILFAGNLRVY